MLTFFFTLVLFLQAVTLILLTIFFKKSSKDSARFSESFSSILEGVKDTSQTVKSLDVDERDPFENIRAAFERQKKKEEKLEKKVMR